MKHFLFIALAGLSLAPTEARLETRAVVCDGCSSTQMASMATNVVDRGTVYVFNAATAAVSKYSVITEMVDTEPFTVWKHAYAMPTEPAISEAFSDYRAALNTLEDEGQVVLPPSFPIRSVAGAYLDPGYSSTTIEDYLNELSVFNRLELDISTIVSLLVQNNVPLIDISGVLKTIRITVEFPDGSTLEYELSYSSDALSGETRLELEPFGNGRLADGRAAPTGSMGFNGVTFHDHNGSLTEWILWARQLGLVVSGSRNGTTMTCAIDGSVITCTVTQSK